MRHPVMGIVATAWLLAACVAGSGPGGSAAPVLQGAVKISAPMGYCIDKAAGQEVDDTAVVVMGRCSASAKVPPALMTVSVGRAGSAGIMAAGGENLAAYFTSPQGRATLSSRGRSADLKVMQALSSGDAFLMRIQEAGAPSYWRAVFGLRGRLVTLSVKSAADPMLDAEDGRKLIDRTVDGLMRANKG